MTDRPLSFVKVFYFVNRSQSIKIGLLINSEQNGEIIPADQGNINYHCCGVILYFRINYYTTVSIEAN